MPTAKRKGRGAGRAVKARLCWQNEFLRRPKFTLHETKQECREQAYVYHPKQGRPPGDELVRWIIPVAIIDLSDFEALVETVRKALPASLMTHYAGDEDHFPRAVLASLGLTAPKARKR